MAPGSSIEQHIRRTDIEVFRAAARLFKVHILVRRTNPASLQYIGRKGYVPKPIDCKPKTADHDVVLASGAMVRCAGLVVDPTLPGFEKAFKSTDKLTSATDIWRRFEMKHGLRADALTPGSTYLSGSSLGQVAGTHVFTLDRGGVYLVQDDKQHAHYGCLYFSPLKLTGAFPKDARAALEPLSTRGANSYLHGDYDLYGIVPADMPDFKTVEQAIMFGAANLYTPESRKIAAYLNRRFGAPMIQHGAQENAPGDHTDDHCDVFWANGDISQVNGRAEIEKLYRIAFRGRKTGAQSTGLITR